MSHRSGMPAPDGRPAPLRPPRAPHADAWALDPGRRLPEPRLVRRRARAPCWPPRRSLRAEMEANPVAFLDRGLEPRLDAARARLARLRRARSRRPGVRARTRRHGVATVLRSLRFGPGDEIVTTDHEYNAALNMARFAAARDGARVVGRPDPAAGRRTRRGRGARAGGDRPADPARARQPRHQPDRARPAGRARSCRLLEARGIPVLVDGAHAPGMLPLDLDALGASFYTGNLHKWVCAPRGRRVPPRAPRPAGGRSGRWPISHGANDPRPGRSTFRKEFDWTGTADPTPYLAVPGGARHDRRRWSPAAGRRSWPGTPGSPTEARRLLVAAAGTPALAPEAMLGSMAALELPPDAGFAARGAADRRSAAGAPARGRDRGPRPRVAPRPRSGRAAPPAAPRLGAPAQ